MVGETSSAWVGSLGYSGLNGSLTLSKSQARLIEWRVIEAYQLRVLVTI